MGWILILLCLMSSDIVSTESDVTINLVPIESVTEVYIGNSLEMNFSVNFPAGVTTAGCKVELILSIGEFLFGVGDVKYCQTGSALTAGNTEYCEQYERYVAPGFNQEDAMKHHSRVAFNIGDVVAGAGTDIERSLSIVFEAVLVSMGDNNIDDEAFISAGMEVENGDYIWVTRYDVILKGSKPDDDRLPNFDLTMVNDNQISTDESQKVQLTFGLPNPQTEVRVEFVSMNGTNCGLSVQDMSLKQAGSAYAYSLDATKLVTNNTGQCCPGSASVNFGRLTNKESTKTNPNISSYDIVIEATIQATNMSISTGSTLCTGVAIFVDKTEVWVSYINVIKTSNKGTSETMFSTRITGDSTVAPGLPCGLEVDIHADVGGNEYTIVIETDKGSAPTPRLHILSINPISSGSNVPCKVDVMNIVYDTSSENSDIFSKATLNVSIHNYGEKTNADSVVAFSVYFRLTTEAQKGEQVHATVSVNGQTGQLQTYTVGKNAMYDNDVSYQFDLIQECSNLFPVGSVLTFTLVVTTERGKIPGPTKLEFPIPYDLQTSLLTFVSAKVVNVGKNVACVTPGDLKIELLDWPASPPGTNDHVIADIVLCNIFVMDDVKEDKFTIEFKVKIKENPNLYKGDSPTDVQFGLGWQFTSTRIWVLNYEIKIKLPHDFGDGTIMYIKGIDYTDSDTGWPVDAMIQWSPNNEQYYNFNVDWEVSNTTNTMLLAEPLFARYVQIVNTNGKCPAKHTYITEPVDTDIEFHGNRSYVKILRQSMMFVLDKDNSTCLTLPLKTAMDTTRFLYFNIKTVLPYLETNGASPFYLIITGTGISCNTPFGPQVTKISYRKDDDALKFKGNRRKCQLDGHVVDDGKQTCRYHCNCSNTTSCADVSILLLHHDVPDGIYNLCDVTALH